MTDPGVEATIRLPSFDFSQEDLRPSAVDADSVWASRGSEGTGVVVVAGAVTQVGRHFIRLLIESRDFGNILVRGLVPSASSGSVAPGEQLRKARRTLDRFCGEDTTRRVELVLVPYFTHAHASVAVDGTVGSSLDPRLGIRPGTLLQSQCLQRAALRKAMAGCLYVISCWGSELQPVFRSNGGELGDGDGDVIGAEYGSVASLLSEAARQSAVHFVHVSAILGQSTSTSLESENRWGLSRWWSSWSLFALLYRSTNEEALLWKERAEHLVRRAGAPESAGGCGLPYTIIRLAPLTPKARPKQVGSAMLFNDGIAVGSSATAEVMISQIAGSTACRRRTSSGNEGVQLLWGPIWEPRCLRPSFPELEPELVDPVVTVPHDMSGSASHFDSAAETTASGSATVNAALKLDPVDAARVVLFCMGNSAILGTSFEVRGRASDDAGVDGSMSRRAQNPSTTDVLPDMLAPLLPDDELQLPNGDDETSLLAPLPTPMQLGTTIDADISSQPATQREAITSAKPMLVRVAPWSRVIAAERIALIDDSTGARKTHPLAREREWEPFICYTVKMHVVLSMLQTQTDLVAATATLPQIPAEGSKPSGELQDWFVCFRFTDFVQLQQGLERNVAERQRQQEVVAQQLQQDQYVTRTFMDEQEVCETGNEGFMGPAARLPWSGQVVPPAVGAVANCAEMLEDDQKLVADLRALLPPSRWFKTTDAVVLERRAALQGYLDLALQAKPSDRNADLWGSSAGCDVSATYDTSGTVADVPSLGYCSLQCCGDLVQKWISVAFARCASTRPREVDTQDDSRQT